MIVVLAGVAGTGKSAVGMVLAAQLGWTFEDTDALHSPAEIAKMRSGVPLTDADRWPWLETVAAWMDQRIAAGESAVVACSALKRSYREYLYRGRPAVRIVLLVADPDTLAARLAGRHGHFFPARLLQSQLADLQMPDDAERTFVVLAVRSPATPPYAWARPKGISRRSRSGQGGG